MRRSETAAYVAWNVDLRRETLDEFSRRMPFQGARVWAVSAGLEAFITQVRYSPRRQRVIHEDIQRMLKDGPPENTTTISLRMRRDLDNVFNELFPEWGATSWFVRNFMMQLTTHMARNNVTLIQLADVAVSLMLSPARTSNEEQGDKPTA